MIIDFHTHIFPPQLIAERQKYLADPCFRLLYSSPKARLAAADELISEMDAAGVDKAVIQNIGWTSHELCVRTNDYLLEAAARYPGRLIPFVAVQPLAGNQAINEIKRCAAAGARGIGELRPDVQGFDLGDDRVIKPFVGALVENSLVLLLHADEPVGHAYPGKGSLTPGVLYPFIAANPDLKLALAHWGGGLPFYALMPEVGAALKNTWFDSAATPYLYRPEVYERAADLVGETRILFGSDWPLLGQRRCLDELKTLNLSTQTLKAVLGGNAAALLGLAND
ncbi:amidohydrolase family protein [Dehalogenimonas sp. 4OHTPN]|uniref:Amidohydrolase family protein n=1 Tax=Dehalogenimonas sp. 4OHTPN TaxID=3166643 RepID=A0AAU8GBU6_9CHLR